MTLEARPVDPSAPGEIQMILDLFRSIFGRPLTEAFYRWRFLENPFGPPLVRSLWDGRSLVGHLAASAMTGWYRGEYFPACQMMTVMTHPDHRRQDVFTRLGEDLYRVTTPLGTRMVWGYPNTKSHFGLVQRQGWRDIALLPTMTRTTADPPRRDARTITVSSEMPTFIDELFFRSDDGRGFLSARDARYMNWRYATNPDVRYMFFTLGSDALAVGKEFEPSEGVRSLEIVDYLHGRRPEAFAELLSQTLCWAKDEGFDLLRLWAPIADPVYPYLEKLSIAPREPLTYLCLRPIAGPPLPETLLRGDGWVVTMGDSDNY